MAKQATLFTTDDIEFGSDVFIDSEEPFLLNVLIKNNPSLLRKLELDLYDTAENSIEINFNFFFKEKLAELEIIVYKNTCEKKFVVLRDMFLEIKDENLKIILKKLNDYLIETKKITFDEFVSLKPKFTW